MSTPYRGRHASRDWHTVTHHEGEEPDAVRVLLACDHIDHDGALHGGGRQLIELVDELQNRPGVEPTVCILRSPTALGNTLIEEGLPLKFFGDHRFSPFSFFRMAHLIQARDIDVLHLTDFGACTWGRLAARATRRPSIVQVITHHSDLQPRGYPKYVEAAYRLMASWTDRVLAISPSVRDFAVDAMGFSADSVEVLPYPLPEHSFKPGDPNRANSLREKHGIPSEAPVVGAITRFHPAKGIGCLLTAWRHVLTRIPDSHLVLVGQGPLEKKLRLQTREFGIEERVVFAGFQRDVPAYIEMFDISAVPSLEEGFGLVALESLALGCPVVASEVGGLPEIVEDGLSGRLVPPADPEALSAALVDLLGDANLRRTMGEHGREFSRRFRLPLYVDRLEEIYRELRDGTP